MGSNVSKSETLSISSTPEPPGSRSFGPATLTRPTLVAKWGILLALSLGLAPAANASSRLYTVSSANMEPTLHCARPAQGCRANYPDKVVVQPVKKVHRGDIVLVQAPQLAKVKCGTTGLFIERVTRIQGSFYFLMGDNRLMSCDSRMWGAVPRLAILGRVVEIDRPTGQKIRIGS